MAGAAGLAIVHVGSAREAATRFAGRTLPERAIALARSAGLDPVLVLADDVGPLAVRAGAGPPIPTVRPGDLLPGLADGRRPVVAWRCDAAFVAGLLRDVLAPGAPVECALRDDAGRVALVRCARDRLGEGLAGADPGAIADRLSLVPREPARHRVLSLAPRAREGRSVREIEAELVATLDNPRDGLFDRLLNRPVSRRLTPLLLDRPITPNQVTLLSLAIGVIAAAAFAAPGRWWPVVGALLVQATAVLDCIDGEIARAKVQESDVGELLDVTSDTLIHVLAFAGIAAHAWPATGSRRAWQLGALFATGGLLSFAVVTRAERTEDRWQAVGSTSSRLLSAMLATLTTRDLSVLLLAAALLGLLRPLLVGAAFGAHAFWILALVLHGRAMREASPGECPRPPDSSGPK